MLSGHTSYINDISFDPANNYLASVSDDQTARIWSTDQFDCVATLILTSAGEVRLLMCRLCADSYLKEFRCIGTKKTVRNCWWLKNWVW